MSYSHSLGHTSGDEEYEDEDDEKRADFEFDDRYSDEDEEEYIRSISPREARKIATLNTEEEEEEEEEKPLLLEDKRKSRRRRCCCCAFKKTARFAR